MRTASISIQAELDIDQNLLGNARFQLFAAQRAGREFIRRARNVAVTLRRDEHQGTIASNQSSYHVKRFEKYRCWFRHVHPTGLVTVERDGYFHEQLASGMDQLISLAFSDECVISDKGAAALSKMTNLETLVVVGFITEAKKTYAVPHFPSLYLIDREGILRVALLHTAGLDDAVAHLMHVEAKGPK